MVSGKQVGDLVLFALQPLAEETEFVLAQGLGQVAGDVEQG